MQQQNATIVLNKKRTSLTLTRQLSIFRIAASAIRLGAELNYTYICVFNVQLFINFPSAVFGFGFFSARFLKYSTHEHGKKFPNCFQISNRRVCSAVSLPRGEAGKHPRDIFLAIFIPPGRQHLFPSLLRYVRRFLSFEE